MTPPRDSEASGAGAAAGALRWWLVGALVAVGLVALALALGSAERAPIRAPAAPGGPGTALALPKLVPLVTSGQTHPSPPSPSMPRGSSPPEVPAFAAPVARSLFDDPMPDLLSKAHEFVRLGKPMRAHKTKELYDFGMANPRDARPWLLLATDDLARGWDGFAVKHYSMAFDADPRAADEPDVAKNLAKISGSAQHGDDAKAAIRKLYGDRAKERMEAQLEHAVRSGDGDAVAAIERLVGEL